MVIYGAVLISIIVTALLFLYFRKQIAWWEYFIPIPVSLLLVIGMKAMIEQTQVTSTEYWGSMVARVEYYEDWDEWITQTCYKECCCDKDGKNCGQEPYDCSHRDYHSAYWQIITTTGETISITESEYARIKGILGNETFKDLGRDYYTKDGDEYYCTWDGSEAKAIPVTTVHSYENRVKATDLNVFHFDKVDDSTKVHYELKDYPGMVNNNYTQNSLLGDNSPDAVQANKKLNYINGKLGPKKQVRVFLLVFKDQPLDAGMYQEWYWAGGNKNEFVVCVGIDRNRNVTWCKPISWTYNETLKVETRDFVTQQKQVNLTAIANYLESAIDTKFQRRHFKEFNYLTVEPPTWAIVLTYIITLLVNFGIGYWVINNEFDEE
ncbi:MAG: hypothetical protein WCG20_01930 [bacterium]